MDYGCHTTHYQTYIYEIFASAARLLVFIGSRIMHQVKIQIGMGCNEIPFLSHDVQGDIHLAPPLAMTIRGSLSRGNPPLPKLGRHSLGTTSLPGRPFCHTQNSGVISGTRLINRASRVRNL